LAACSAGQPGHAAPPSPEPALSAAPAGASVRHAPVPPPAARRTRAAQPAPLRKEAAVAPARPNRPQAAAARSLAEAAAAIPEAALIPAAASIPAAALIPAAASIPAAPAIPALPAIISASALPSVVREGDTITWEVRTTRDVVAVEAHVRLASFPLQRDRPGHFEMVFRVPAGVPPFFHGTYAIELTARTATGASATRTLEVRFE
jgi:hypothetical protein